MAKKRSSGGRQAKAKSKKRAPAVAEVEIVEEAAGEGIDGGIAIVTTLCLVAAILFLDRLLAGFDAGVFF